MKELPPCPSCQAPAPAEINPTGIQLGGYVEWQCQCGKTQVIPWGRASLQLIEMAREAERKKG